MARAVAWLCNHICLTSWYRPLLTSHLALLAVLMALDKLSSETDHRLAVSYQSEAARGSTANPEVSWMLPVRPSGPRPKARQDVGQAARARGFSVL